jgi:hypothetical protein
MPAADLVVNAQQLRELFFGDQILLVSNLQNLVTDLTLMNPVMPR